MSIFSDIPAALMARIQSIPSVPPVAWPNAGYSPAIGTNYLKVMRLPAETITNDLAYGEMHAGILQIDAVTPISKGEGAALALADSIADHFRSQRLLTHDGQDVRIRSISIAQAFTDDSWYSIPVSIDYEAHA